MAMTGEEWRTMANKGRRPDLLCDAFWGRRPQLDQEPVVCGEVSESALRVA